MAGQEVLELKAEAGVSYIVAFNEASGAGYLLSYEADRGVEVEPIYEDLSDEDIEAIGGSVLKQFRIMAREAGEYSVTFTHKRPWEDKSIEEFKLSIRVSP